MHGEELCVSIAVQLTAHNTTSQQGVGAYQKLAAPHGTALQNASGPAFDGLSSSVSGKRNYHTAWA
jgi:hypothetical protein